MSLEYSLIYAKFTKMQTTLTALLQPKKRGRDEEQLALSSFSKKKRKLDAQEAASSNVEAEEVTCAGLN